MHNLKIKVCGMRDPAEIKKLVKLNVDYLGFNFYEKSPRYINCVTQAVLEVIPENIMKVGVFVNAHLDFVIETAKNNKLNIVQLHGNETAGYCKYLYVHGISVIKAFQIGEDFDFKQVNAYETHCKYFLFDNKSKAFGGSGRKFNWNILEKFDNTKIPYFLSGGIDIDDVEEIRNLKFKRISIYGIDINSKFETAPGRKDVEKIAKFIKELRTDI